MDGSDDYIEVEPIQEPMNLGRPMRGPMPPPGSPYYKGKMAKCAVIGIVITSVLLILLFVAIFAPWFAQQQVLVKNDDVPDYYYDDEDLEGDWKYFDYDGEEIGADDHRGDDMGLGYFGIGTSVDMGFAGIIIGMILGIGMIVIGNIPLGHPLGQRIMVLIRGVSGLGMVLSGTFLAYCASGFIGLSIMVTTQPSTMYEHTMFPITPLILGIAGLFIIVLGFSLFTYNFKLLKKMGPDQSGNLKNITHLSIPRIKKLASMILILSLLALVTLDLLPVIIATVTDEDWITDEEVTETTYMASGMFSDLYNEDAMDYYFWFEFSLWFIFIGSILAMFSVLFLQSGFHDLTGFIFTICTTPIGIFVALAILFKILFIIFVFSPSSNGYLHLMDSTVYGYNYLPLLFLIGIVIAVIMFMVSSIKFGVLYFKEFAASMPRGGRYPAQAYPMGAYPPPPPKYYANSGEPQYYDDRVPAPQPQLYDQDDYFLPRDGQR